MADFGVRILRIDEVNPIEGADKIEAVKIGDYNCVVAKGEYKPGDLVAYIPEQAVVPEDILVEMGLKGRLAGQQKNRVKAIKLRGVLSQGLIYSLGAITERLTPVYGSDIEFYEGSDFAEALGITKYEPPMPAHFKGQLSRPRGNYSLLKYDIENIKGYKNVLQDGEEVQITEKIHGTLMQAVYWPEEGQFAVASKGLGARGFIIEDTDANQGNVYIRAARLHNVEAKIKNVAHVLHAMGFGNKFKALFVVGEVFGSGVQDLGYGHNELGLRVFDIYVGEPGTGQYLDAQLMRNVAELVGFECVPLLYQGPYSREVLDGFTTGMETVSGKKFNIREGVVVKPVEEREDPKLGRVILKSVSEAYLLRKGEVTEYN